MFVENDHQAARQRLTSWKEIAAYLGRNERTVKRWEASRGLPVRRVGGAARGSVFAYADELEAWMGGGAAAEVDEVQHVSPTAAQPKQGSTSRFKGLSVVTLFAVVAIAIASFVYFIERQSAPVAGPGTRDPVAANLYRAGLNAWQTRTPSGLSRAIVEFQQAIARDPGFADAYVGLADAYDLQGEYTAALPDRAYPKAAEAAQRAIALDPSLAGAHAALAFSKFYGARDIRGAEDEFRRAISLDPRSAIAHHWFATVLMTTGHFREALAEIDRAENLDAESAAIQADKALIEYHAGKKADATRLLGQLEEDNPNFASPHKYLALIHLDQGDDAAFARELKLVALARHDDAGNTLADAAASGLAEAGRAGMLRAMLDAQKKLFDADRATANSVAQTCAMLGDEACARTYLGISVARREADNIALDIDPCFARFHTTNWFAALLAQAEQGRP
jgi:tetratricopeptide (TPR) repeat protein